MRLSHNIASLNIYKEYSKSVEKQSTANGRISSGSKINRAIDNPNMIAKSERLRMQLKGNQMAQRNIQDGVGLLQTADGSLDGITTMLQRIKELTIQAGSAANNNEQKGNIKNEIDQLVQGIDNIVESSQFNGTKLLNDNSTFDIQLGPNIGEKISIGKFNFESGNLKDLATGKSIKDIDISNSTGVTEAGIIVDSAIDTVLAARSTYGAIQNRLESSMESLEQIHDRIQDSESGIRDVDIAEEMMEYAKSNILIEAGNAMMVQSNKFPQDILRILDRR